MSRGSRPSRTVDGGVRPAVVVAVGVVLLLSRVWRLSSDLAEQRRLAADPSELSRRFEHQSLHDPLTGLANRSLFTEQLQHAWAAQERHGRGLALLILDLDGFKVVNDRYGHHTGDQVLIEVAHRLQRCTRASDTLARVGGDEFALVLPGTDLREAQTIARRIHERLAPPVLVGGRTLAVAASIGIARPTSRSQDLDALVRRADAAMYTIKARRRG